MNIKILSILCTVFCLCACQDQRFLAETQATETPIPGETVQAVLALNVVPLQDEFPAALSGKAVRGTGNSSGLSASYPGMKVELGSPASATRGPVRYTEENEIHSLVVLQFRASNGECLRGYYTDDIEDGVINVSKLKFVNLPHETSKIVAIANVGLNFPGLMDVTKWPSLRKKFQDLMDLDLQRGGEKSPYPLHKSPDGKNRAIMIGEITLEVENWTLVSIELHRIFAKASFQIEIVPELKAKYKNWKAELVSMPSKNYFIMEGRKEPFPSIEELGKSKPYYTGPEVSAKDGIFPPDALDTYIPANLQPLRPLSTEKTRALNAPSGSTYLQITGYNTVYTIGNNPKAVSMTDIVTYHLYLGNDLTSNYSISPNTFYSYRIKVDGEDPEDTSVIKFIPGYFGGKMVAFAANGTKLATITDPKAVKWRYENKIELYPKDLTGDAIGDPTDTPKWSLMSPGVKFTEMAKSYTDGKYNTWVLMNGSSATDISEQDNNSPDVVNRYNFTAAYASYMLNADRSRKDALKWYMPAIQQLIGVYIAASNSIFTLGSSYWSSTVNAKNPSTAYFVGKSGTISELGLNTGMSARAVRDVEDK